MWNGDMDVQIKRIYQEVEESDGKRILVDRLWPRGITRVKAGVDAWAKNIAPSKELRQWYHSHTEQYGEFVLRYHQELAANPLAVVFHDEIMKCLSEGNVTLVTSSSLAKNNATALLEWLQNDVTSAKSASHDKVQWSVDDC